MAGSNITCRLFAAFERFKNPNLIRLAKYLPAYKGKIGLAVCCMLTAGLSSSLIFSEYVIYTKIMTFSLKPDAKGAILHRQKAGVC